MDWIMWKKERVHVVKYIKKLVSKGRNNKKRIKLIPTHSFKTVVRKRNPEEVGSYPKKD